MPSIIILNGHHLVGVSMEDESSWREVPKQVMPYTDIYEKLIPVIFEGIPREDQPTAYRDRIAAAVQYGPDFLEQLFGALHWDRSSEASGKKGSEIHVRWRHRSVGSIQDDIRELRIYADQLKIAVAEYLRRPAFRTEYLDWYCADTLTYAEYVGSASQVQSAFGGPFTTALIRHGGGAKFTAYFCDSQYSQPNGSSGSSCSRSSLKKRTRSAWWLCLQ